jgi:cytochrome c-type biogenesis protein CcsB
MKSVFFDISFVAYALALLGYALGYVFRRKLPLRAAVPMACLAVASQAAFLVHRWAHAGRAPFATMFETLVTISFCLGAMHVTGSLIGRRPVLGTSCCLIALLTQSYATVKFGTHLPYVVPVLQNSFWLTVHVLLCCVGYAALIIAFICAMELLLSRRDTHGWMAAWVLGMLAAATCLLILMCSQPAQEKITSYLIQHFPWALSQGEPVPRGLSLRGTVIFLMLVLTAGLILCPLIKLLHRLLARKASQEQHSPWELFSRSTLLGFALLGVGIIAGAIWADVAWGRYWGWDPKETWSLITWLTYGVCLHLRYVLKRGSPATLWVNVAGFFCMMFTLFGVNFLLSGLHGYA